MRLVAKSAIVTGAGSGIGKSIALKLSEHGAHILAVDIDLKSAENTAYQIINSGGNAIPVKVDVSNKKQVIEMKERVLKEYGSVDILVNNAGIVSAVTPTEDLPEEDWDRVISINLKGVFLCSQAVGKEMISKKKGVIVNIASICGHVGYLMGGAYSASKAGVVLLTQQLALEWAKYNIRVNSISPGMIRTPMAEINNSNPEIYNKRIGAIPLHRIGDAEEIANTTLFLVSDDASYITGTDIIVDGGFIRVQPVRP